MFREVKFLKLQQNVLNQSEHDVLSLSKNNLGINSFRILLIKSVGLGHQINRYDTQGLRSLGFFGWRLALRWYRT